MTSLTQATSLSTDPVMREAEIKALKDQVAVLTSEADALEAKARSGPRTTHTYGFGIRAKKKRSVAAQIQRRLDDLDRGR